MNKYAVPRRNLKAEGLLVLITFIWGGTFVVIKGALGDISPLLLVSVRFLLSALIAVPFLTGNIFDSAGRKKNGLRLFSVEVFKNRNLWMWGFFIALGMLAGYAGQTIGLKYTTVARSGFITYSFALYVPFLQYVFLKRKPGAGNIIGLFIVMWGLAYITAPSAEPLTLKDLSPYQIISTGRTMLSGGLNKGDLYTLIGTIGYAFYVVLLDKASNKHNPGALTVVQMLLCGLMAFAVTPFSEELYIHLTFPLAGALLYLVFPGGIFALFIMNRYQKELSPLKAVLIYALEPVFAAFTGWLVYRGVFSGREVLGALLILSGIIISDIRLIISGGIKTKRNKPINN